MSTRRTPAGFYSTSISRRDLLRGGASLAGGALLAPLLPAWLAPHSAAAWQQAAAPADALAAMRAGLGSTPIARVTLTDTLTMLSGPGGNVVVLNGTDGQVVVDSFVQPAWDALSRTLAQLGKGPVTALIDTHWHVDHADNNANFRKAGAAIVAHANTAVRLRQSHELLGMKIPPAPAEALPTQTFTATHQLSANGEQITLGYIPPSHTDTDIYIRFARGNVLHLGDVFFNGMYPFIDASTGGSIGGMIAGADLALKLPDSATKIVPGHGPVGDRTALTTYRDMLVTVRDRVTKLKSSGRTLEEAVAANPTADLDAMWGKGFMAPKDFVALVYGTI